VQSNTPSEVRITLPVGGAMRQTLWQRDAAVALDARQ
jgi:hypothetical protein